MKSPYEQGFDARICGEQRSSNPFQADSKDFLAWASGWDDQDYHLTARDEALDSIGWFG